MIKEVRKYLELPVLYRETEVAFWDDDYISVQMLKAHLDPENDGASRKIDFIEQSVSWIKEVASPHLYPALLDVGCGPGLYAERFTKCGYRVTGVDFSRRSIAYAQDSAEKSGLKIEYKYQNYLALDLEDHFDMATLIYCDYGVLSTQNRRTVLQNIYKQLKPGGILILDVFSMEKYRNFEESQTWKIHNTGGFWREDGYVELIRNYKFSDRVTLEQITIVSDKDIAAYYLWNTYFTDNALIEEAAASGFKIEGIYGDAGGSPYCEKCATIAVVLKKMDEIG